MGYGWIEDNHQDKTVNESSVTETFRLSDISRIRVICVIERLAGYMLAGLLCFLRLLFTLYVFLSF